MFATEDNSGGIPMATTNGDGTMAVGPRDLASPKNGYDLKKDDAEKIVAIVASGK